MFAWQEDLLHQGEGVFEVRGRRFFFCVDSIDYDIEGCSLFEQRQDGEWIFLGHCSPAIVAVLKGV